MEDRVQALGTNGLPCADVHPTQFEGAQGFLMARFIGDTDNPFPVVVDSADQCPIAWPLPIDGKGDGNMRSWLESEFNKKWKEEGSKVIGSLLNIDPPCNKTDKKCPIVKAKLVAEMGKFLCSYNNEVTKRHGCLIKIQPLVAGILISPA
jgi:hypothetical protein